MPERIADARTFAPEIGVDPPIENPATASPYAAFEICAGSAGDDQEGYESRDDTCGRRDDEERLIHLKTWTDARPEIVEEHRDTRRLPPWRCRESSERYWRAWLRRQAK